MRSRITTGAVLDSPAILVKLPKDRCVAPSQLVTFSGTDNLGFLLTLCLSFHLALDVGIQNFKVDATLEETLTLLHCCVISCRSFYSGGVERQH